jgi:hypothetical protein
MRGAVGWAEARERGGEMADLFAQVGRVLLSRGRGPSGGVAVGHRGSEPVVEIERALPSRAQRVAQLAELARQALYPHLGRARRLLGGRPEPRGLRHGGLRARGRLGRGRRMQAGLGLGPVAGLHRLGGGGTCGVAVALGLSPEGVGGVRSAASVVPLGLCSLGTGESLLRGRGGGFGLGLGLGDPLIGQRHRLGGKRPRRLGLGQRGRHRFRAMYPYPFGLVAGSNRVGAGLVGLPAGLAPFRVGRGHLRGGVRPNRGQLTLDTGGGELGVKGVGERLGHAIEPVEYLEGLRHLSGEAGSVALTHPDGPGRPQARVVVVATVSKWSTGRCPLGNRPSTVGTRTVDCVSGRRCGEWGCLAHTGRV